MKKKTEQLSSTDLKVRFNAKLTERTSSSNEIALTFRNSVLVG